MAPPSSSPTLDPDSLASLSIAPSSPPVSRYPLVSPDEYLTEHILHHLYDGFTAILPTETPNAALAFEYLTTQVKLVYSTAVHSLERGLERSRGQEALIANLKSQAEYAQRQLAKERTRVKLGTQTAGSVTRSEVWNSIQAHYSTTMDSTLPHLAAGEAIDEAALGDLLETEFTKEQDMYAPVTECLARLFNSEGHPGIKVSDTHGVKMLGGYSPDISIGMGNMRFPDVSSVFLVIELKLKDIDSAGFGQVYDYLLAMRSAQPNRRHLAALLSTIHVNHFITMRNNGSDWRITHYQSVGFIEALSYIQNIVLKDVSFRPPTPSFSIGLGIMERRLGNPHHSIVAEFMIPSPELVRMRRIWPTEPLGTTMAVKIPAAPPYTPEIKSEVSMLKFIEELGGCQQLPRLVFSSDDCLEFGIVPVGEKFDLSNLKQPAARTILGDVLSALIWLHSHNIVHRDVRRDNIIVTSQPNLDNITGDPVMHGRLIDLGASTYADGKEQSYIGGYICCPRDLIGDFSKRYVPHCAHDYMAFVMMVNLLVFPHALGDLVSNMVGHASAEADRLKLFWDEMAKSVIWGPFVEAAENEDVDTLAGLSKIFVLL